MSATLVTGTAAAPPIGAIFPDMAEARGLATVKKNGGNQPFFDGNPRLSTIRGNASTSLCIAEREKTRTDRRRQAVMQRAKGRAFADDIHKPVSLCGLKPMGNVGMIQCVGDRARLEGMMTCKSPWACPVCAPKVASERAGLLAPQIRHRLDLGWTAWLVTLTLRHERGNDLVGLLVALGKAWGRMVSGRNGQTFRRLGMPEFVRGYDLTRSDRNGWHPHIHTLLLLPPGHGDGSATAHEFEATWRKVMAALGFEALQVGQDVQRCMDASAAATYAIKAGHVSEAKPVSAHEAVSAAMKTGRGQDAGMTAFDILRAAVAGDGSAKTRHMIALWREYLKATKGRKQVTVSRGLKLAGDETLELKDEDQSEDDHREPVTVASLGTSALIELDRTFRMAPLLEAIEQAPESHKVEAARRVLMKLRSRDWWLPGDPPMVVSTASRGSTNAGSKIGRYGGSGAGPSGSF